MKSLLFLALGVACGAIGTVLAFSIDTSSNGAADVDGAGGGNVTVIFTEEALAELVSRELPEIPAFGERPVTEITVGTNGIVRADISVGGLGVGFRATITVNPNIVGGRVQLDVVDASLGELAVPEDVADLIEQPIQRRVDGVAGEFEYRVTAIRTTDHRLTIEVEI